MENTPDQGKLKRTDRGKQCRNNQQSIAGTKLNPQDKQSTG